MLFGETVAVYCENHTEHINTVWALQRKYTSTGEREAVLQRVKHRTDMNPLETVAVYIEANDGLKAGIP
jgi:hypothetical protein